MDEIGQGQKMNFYPRPPRGGRQAHIQTGRPDVGISTHALREEGDVIALADQYKLINFYPRPPRGGRRS